MVEARQRSRDERSDLGTEFEARSVAQLNMLHSLAARLNRLNDVQEIGEAITAELGKLIDYHNCRIHLLQPDEHTLVPVVFRGELTQYLSETYEELITQVGEGMTGHVAATGRSFYAPNAQEVEFAIQIPGTPEIDESFLAVPLLVGDRVTGVFALSKLGIDQFDQEDMRLLEVLASHAAVAFENARLFQLEREAAETSSALLGLSQALTGIHDLDTVFDRVLAATPAIIPCAVFATYVRNPTSGAFRLSRFRSFEADASEPTETPDIDPEIAARYLISLEEPFILSREVVAQVPTEYKLAEEPGEVLVAPLTWEPDGFAAIVVVAFKDGTFSERDVRLARGIADITSLALGSARRFNELERFHELVETLEAIFWEADPSSFQFSFLSRRAAELLGPGFAVDPSGPQRWGDHVSPEDQDEALAAFRSAIEIGGDHPLEYRASGPDGETVWLRDLVHVVRDPQGETQLIRGLMVDITERKQAEQALRKSERKYSEAFKREREATQRLRALDEMKNTFLEAVSHDLRTPLTSILGSALTLEQTRMNLPPDDALDLIRRIASNSRKLERLLSDLLDLDRLQRGILSPLRRPTDVGALVRQTVRDTDVLGARSVDVQVEQVVVAVDAAKVERIIENLLANAARHTPTDSRLWVRACAHEGGVLIVVEDEGPGVPAEMRKAVFEPFRQLAGKPSHAPGVGVGLSLVGRFAELHDGRAWVEERSGGGASFRVFLPGTQNA